MRKGGVEEAWGFDLVQYVVILLGGEILGLGVSFTFIGFFLGWGE